MFLKSPRQSSSSCPLPCDEYRRMEGFEDAEIPAVKTSMFAEAIAWLQRVGRALADRLLAEPELTVREKRDRFGNPYWYAYDPKSGHSFTSASETELLAWIEARYYF